MSLAQGNNTPIWPRVEPGSPDPESDALTTRPVRPLLSLVLNLVSNNKSSFKWFSFVFVAVAPSKIYRLIGFISGLEICDKSSREVWT